MTRKFAILAAIAASCTLWLGAGSLSRLGTEEEKPRSRKFTPIPGAAHNLRVPGVTPQWLEAVGRQLERFERTIRPLPNVSETYVAASKACFARISPGGMNVVSSWHEDTWKLDWTWCSVAGLVPASPTISTPGEFLIHVDRGPILEIFENRKDGLEHVIEVKEKPRSAGPLRVDIAVASGLSISSPKTSDRLEFSDSSGSRVLQYRGLKVWDSRGEKLAAAFEVTPTGFSISVQDSLAHYPVTIDPVFDAVDWDMTGPVSAPPGSTTQMGFSVATAGDIDGDGSADLVVGAPFLNLVGPQSGMVWIFLGSTVGAPDDIADFGFDGAPQTGSLFGWSVGGGDIDGDGDGDVIAGSPSFDVVGAPDGGAAWVYLYEGPAFAADLLLPPSGGVYQTGAQRGFSVANVGDVTGDGIIDFVVGEPFYDPLPFVGFGALIVDAGQICLYSIDPAGALGLPIDVANGAIIGAAGLVEDAQTGAWFGWSVAGAGSINPAVDGVEEVLVGAPGYDDLGNSLDNVGRALMYFADAAAGTLMPGPGWYSSGENEAGAQFGFSVAGGIDVSDDEDPPAQPFPIPDALIGAPYFDGDGTDIGRVYLYLGVEDVGYEVDFEWASSGEEDGAEYGYAVAWGDTGADTGLIIIGSPGYDDETGRAYAFVWTGSDGAVTIDEDDPAYETGEAVGDRFGHSVVIFASFDDDAGLDAFIGAPGFEELADADQGRVYGFYD